VSILRETLVMSHTSLSETITWGNPICIMYSMNFPYNKKIPLKRIDQEKSSSKLFHITESK
jgi:hypothetical protein